MVAILNFSAESSVMHDANMQGGEENQLFRANSVFNGCSPGHVFWQVEQHTHQVTFTNFHVGH